MGATSTDGGDALAAAADDTGAGTAGRLAARAAGWLAPRLPGLAAATAIASLATVVGRRFPVVGGPVTGIVFGVAVGSLLGRLRGARQAVRPGTAFAGRQVLQLSVVVLGSQLSLAQIARVGGSSLPVMLGTLAVCLAAAWALGQTLRLRGDLSTLIGVGTGICGASAIAAVTPVIGALGVDVAYAISTIFLFNITAVLVFPLVGHLLGMSQHAFGLFAGTAVNDTSSVVAAATTYGAVATQDAVVVKLTRTLMIIPVSVGLAVLVARRGRRTTDAAAGGEPAGRMSLRVWRLVPWFLVGFLVFAALNTGGAVPAPARHELALLATFLITVALSAIGLSTDVAAFRRAGARPLLLGGLLWLAVSGTSLGLQAATGLL